MVRRFLMWLVWNVRLGPLAPWVMGLALGRMPRRVKQKHGPLPMGNGEVEEGKE